MAKKKASTGHSPDRYREKALEKAIRGEFEEIDAKTFLKVCKSNPGYATLTPYTLKEMSNRSVFKLWRLKNAKVYYGLKVDGSEVELIDVFNNDRELPAIATGSAILHAIEQGVTCLTAFDLHDILPKRYERYGFVRVEPVIKFDYKFREKGKYAWLDKKGELPNTRLKKAEEFWSTNKWEPFRTDIFADNYPGVQMMELKATTEERAVARDVYIHKMVQLNIADWGKYGITVTASALKQYGTGPVSDECINSSMLLTCLSNTAEEILSAMSVEEKKACKFEGMVLGDMSWPLFEQASENTMRMKMQRGLEEYRKKKPVRTSPRSSYNSKLNALIDTAYNNEFGKAFELLVKTGIDVGLPSRSYKHSVKFSPPSNRTRRLFTISTQQRFISGAARVYVDVEAFEQFMKVPQSHVAKELGSGTLDLGPKTAEKFAKNLRQLLDNKEDRGP